MVNVRGIARLGTLAVGLGIGAAWAHTPVASADSSSDWLSTVDGLLSGASPAPATPIDLDISYDGYTIYDGGGSATADTTTGDYSLAIAYGDHAVATAYGTGNTAIADGDGANAFANAGTGDYALADGTNADAGAGGVSGATGANYDTAIDIGNNDVQSIGEFDGAFAGNADLEEPGGSGTGSYDTAIDIGNNTNDASLASNGNDGSYGLDGNGNYASESGSTTGEYEYASASEGNDNTAIADTSYTTNDSDVAAYGGNDNYASVDGPANSTATASGGSDVAYVNDPFGAAGSPDSAIAGDGSSNDLAEVLLAHGNATADTANLLYDIVSLFGNTAGSF